MPFFPHFYKLDFFDKEHLDVIDCSFTAMSCHILCHDKEKGSNRVFSIGNNENGCLGNNSALNSHNPVEITDKIPSEVIQIASGGYHTLALTSDSQVFGFGKLTKGQLGFKWTKDTPKFSKVPIRVPIDTQNRKIEEIYCGSLFSMAKVES